MMILVRSPIAKKTSTCINKEIDATIPLIFILVEFFVGNFKYF